MSKSFIVITATGKDKPGLTTEITELIANVNGNIVDIEAFRMRGLFAIFMIVDCRFMSLSLKSLRSQFTKMGKKIGLDVNIESLPSGRRKSGKKLVLLTTLGKDRSGIVAKISRFLSQNNANIERVRMIAYGELNAMEILIDVNDLKIPFDEFKKALSKECWPTCRPAPHQMFSRVAAPTFPPGPRWAIPLTFVPTWRLIWIKPP